MRHVFLEIGGCIEERLRKLCRLDLQSEDAEPKMK